MRLVPDQHHFTGVDVISWQAARDQVVAAHGHWTYRLIHDALLEDGWEVDYWLGGWVKARSALQTTLF